MLAELLADALAAHRITRLMTEDVITEPVRDAIWARFPPEHRHGPGYVLTCPYCSSVYAGLAVAATRTRPFRFLRPVIYGLALSGAVSLVHEYAPQRSGWQ